VRLHGKSDKFAAVEDLLMFPEIEACLKLRPVCVSAAVHFEEFKCGRGSREDFNGISAALDFCGERVRGSFRAAGSAVRVAALSLSMGRPTN